MPYRVLCNSLKTHINSMSILKALQERSSIRIDHILQTRKLSLREKEFCLRLKALAIHSSTLAWKIPWMEDPVGYSPWGREESDTTEQLHFHFSLACTGEGNGNPHQCSCLENSRDGGTLWAAVYGIAQSRTWLMWLSSSSSSSMWSLSSGSTRSPQVFPAYFPTVFKAVVSWIKFQIISELSYCYDIVQYDMMIHNTKEHLDSTEEHMDRG